MELTKVSAKLAELREELYKARDNEISMANECASQYVTDHGDKSSYRDIDRAINRLAKAWDKMIDKLDKWTVEAEKIEASCDNARRNEHESF
jgi:hypothetical protein